ncbi:hypothetical protein TNIN_490521 [Trichonephila inaurata madagascariensis]|uniref:Uncharacterized protein n=1 Tax=Trichonephila inaurata madagascariensis TaxID=2747483 RepID=A0A8X7BTJ2_9ARAC|nr:hypothetical protein TNIN_490521 [Trichonephila inaurata madagascariensis]
MPDENGIELKVQCWSRFDVSRSGKPSTSIKIMKTGSIARNLSQKRRPCRGFIHRSEKFKNQSLKSDAYPFLLLPGSFTHYFKDPGASITEEQYSETLARVRRAIKVKHPGKL